MKYQSIVSGSALPVIRDIMGNGYILQQDKFSIHIVPSTIEFFENCGIDVFNWSSRSPFKHHEEWMPVVCWAVMDLFLDVKVFD